MSASNTLPSEIPFASFFVYSPRPVPGEGKAGEDSRRLVRSIKAEAQQASRRWKLAAFVRDNIGGELRERYLSPDTTLVPMPKHAPLKDLEGSHWPTRDLCTEFLGAGLGLEQLPLLKRVHHVAKAVFSDPSARPTAQDHFNSLRCLPQLGVAENITIVDDIITRGATMLAAVAAVRSAFPGCSVQGFALIRTMSDVALEDVVAPVQGTVRLTGADTARRP